MVEFSNSKDISPATVKAYIEKRDPTALDKVGKRDQKLLIDRETGEITSVSLKTTEWLNHIIVWFKTVFFKTDIDVEEVFLRDIKAEYKSIKKDYKEIKKGKKEFHVTDVEAPKIKALKVRVNQLNNLLDDQKGIVAHHFDAREKYVGKAQKLHLEIDLKSFLHEWKGFKRAIKPKTLKEQEVYFKNGLEILKNNSLLLKNLDMESHNEIRGISREVNAFLNDYKKFIGENFRSLNTSLKQSNNSEAFLEHVKEVSGFYDFVEDLNKHLFQLGSASIKIIHSPKTDENYKEVINTIENRFTKQIEDFNTNRSNARKEFFQTEIKREEVSAPLDRQIGELNKKIELQQPILNALQDAIGSLLKQEQQSREKSESPIRQLGEFIHSKIMPLQEESIPQQIRNIKLNTEAKKLELKLLMEEIAKDESKILELNKEKERALSKIPGSNLQTIKDIKEEGEKFIKEQKELMKLSFLHNNGILSEQKLALKETTKALAKEIKVFEKYKETIIEWAALEKNLQMHKNSPEQYVGEGCKIIEKLAHSSIETRKIIKKNMDVVKFFEKSHELLALKRAEIEINIRGGFQQIPPDVALLIGLMDELNKLMKAYGKLNHTFSDESFADLYGYDFLGSKENIVAIKHHKELHSYLKKLGSTVYTEREKFQHDYHEMVKDLKSDIAESGVQIKRTRVNIKAISEGLESIKQDKEELERSLEAEVEEMNDKLPKWQSLKDSVVRYEQDVQGAERNIEALEKAQLQKEELRKLITAGTVKQQKIRADIRKQEAMIATETETLKQLKRTSLETQRKQLAQSNDLQSIQSAAKEFGANLDVIIDRLKGILDL